MFLIGVADKHMEYSFSTFSFWKHYAAPTARYIYSFQIELSAQCIMHIWFTIQYNDGIWRYFNRMKFFIDTWKKFLETRKPKCYCGTEAFRAWKNEYSLRDLFFHAYNVCTAHCPWIWYTGTAFFFKCGWQILFDIWFMESARHRDIEIEK